MEIYATKGAEYLLVIAYLLLLILFAWFARATAPRRALAAAPARALGLGGWFAVPEDLHFHRGHTWARDEGGGVLRVGIDDFAAKLLGRAEALRLPASGSRLEQGDAGWRMDVDGRGLELLSPVGGEVLEVNEEAVRAPERVSDDPYGDGWLLKVRSSRPAAALKNLLPGRLARAWTDQAAARLNTLMGGELGVVLQDGGVPVPGFARHLAGERWHEMAAELLLTA
jgi:glycine cleavage system H lipoate-binding protein